MEEFKELLERILNRTNQIIEIYEAIAYKILN